jgi:hypothetical protein
MDYIDFRIYFGGFDDTIHMGLIDDVISMEVDRLTILTSTTINFMGLSKVSLMKLT